MIHCVRANHSVLSYGLDQVTHALKLPVDLNLLPLLVFLETVWIAIMFGQCQAEIGLELCLAVLTLTDAMKYTTVVLLWKAYHIEEHTIQFISSECFSQHLQ
jgi:hypothetical protein